VNDIAVDTDIELSHTKRATVPALENILYKPFPVLDHGFIRVIDYMGDDASIVQAARVSYGKGTKKKTEDQGLINYLMRHRHTTPFEMCEIKLHVKLPMFVARQWIRHRTANVNEYSARYSILDKEFYIPKAEHLAPQSQINKQGRSEPMNIDQATNIQNMLAELCVDAYHKYQYFLNEEGQHDEHPGIARELARTCLPVNFYTQWYWKIDLHNLLHFIKLRADPHAQYEIRVYADILAQIVKQWVPFAYEAFEDYSRFGTAISQKGLEVIKRMIQGEKVDQTTSGLSGREWVELMEKLA
jgi:thymidylate synthase (FAD)